MDVEDPIPELPDPNPRNTIADVELDEEPHSGGVEPLTVQGGSPADDDDEVIAIAKKILEHYKKTGRRPDADGEE